MTIRVSVQMLPGLPRNDDMFSYDFVFAELPRCGCCGNPLGEVEFLDYIVGSISDWKETWRKEETHDL